MRRFTFRLALALGKTVEELLTGQPAPLSFVEQKEWVAFSNLEPFGDPYYQTAVICASSYNAAGRKKAVQPEDIFPSLNERRPKQTPLDWLERFKAIAARKNG